MRGLVWLGAAAVLLATVFVGTVQQAAAAPSNCADAGRGSDITGSVHGALSDDGRRLTVTTPDRAYVISAVGVRGGGAYAVYTSGSYSNLTAPENRGGQLPRISDWYACGERRHVPTRSPSPTSTPPSPSPTPTTEPTRTPTGSPTGTPEVTSEPTDPPRTADPTDPEETPEADPTVTGSPEPSDLPTSAVPVPTAIPAGGPPPPASSPWGMLAVVGAGALVSGAIALLLRRRTA
ncbi:hypothetical protein [Phytoactinopolyspora limicola]|uniref:hypothetical protein n=1 Tax=Phytoactinopolyspora limicola TaxID=2715536 RepID=UPI00140B4F00|nr:hypothetical protein [Phytoactinopolyspora limicola]